MRLVKSDSELANQLDGKLDRITDSKLGKIVTMLFHASTTDTQSTSIKLGDTFSALTSLLYFNRTHYMKRSWFIAIAQVIKLNLEQ